MDLLDEILAAGCAAPSALNQQPWSFTVVTDPERISALAEHCADTRDFLAEKSGKGWVAKYDMGFIAAAKALIFIATDPSKIGLGKFMAEEGAHRNAASACIQNMLLAITAKGLGSLWFTMYDKGHIHKTLQVSQELDVVGLLPVGVPAADMPAIPRRAHSEVTTYFA